MASLRTSAASSRSGFSLPEVLVALGVFSLLAGVGLSSSLFGYLRGSLRDDETRTVDLLLRAREEAMHGIGGSTYGVRISESTITLFKGTTFDSRNTAYDETYTRSAPGSVEEPTTITFSARTGEAQSGSITFFGTGGTTHTITVNSAGGISED